MPKGHETALPVEKTAAILPRVSKADDFEDDGADDEYDDVSSKADKF